MKHVLEGVNFVDFLQNFWKEYKFPKVVIWKTVF